MDDIENFYTYSYVCVDSEYWNETTDFKEIENQYFKFYYTFPSSHNSDFSKDYSNIMSKLKYIKRGFTKTSFTLFTSGIETTNFTRIPYEYENQHLYTFILRLYQKIFMQKIINDEKNEKENIKDIMNMYVNFIGKFYFSEISNTDVVTENYKKWERVLEIKTINSEVLSKYDSIYKKISLLQNRKYNKIMYITVGITFILTIINIILFIMRGIL